jgi:hypothetical protein
MATLPTRRDAVEKLPLRFHTVHPATRNAHAVTGQAS